MLLRGRVLTARRHLMVLFRIFFEPGDLEAVFTFCSETRRPAGVPSIHPGSLWIGRANQMFRARLRSL